MSKTNKVSLMLRVEHVTRFDDCYLEGDDGEEYYVPLGGGIADAMSVLKIELKDLVNGQLHGQDEHHLLISLEMMAAEDVIELEEVEMLPGKVNSCKVYR